LESHEPAMTGDGMGGERDRGACRSGRQIKIVYWDFHFVGDYLKAESRFFFAVSFGPKATRLATVAIGYTAHFGHFVKDFTFGPLGRGQNLAKREPCEQSH